MSNAAKAWRRYTWDDYRNWSGDRRWELIGGEAVAMAPSPSERHQLVQMNISAALHAFLRGRPCRVYTAPFDVKLSNMNVDGI